MSSCKAMLGSQPMPGCYARVTPATTWWCSRPTAAGATATTPIGCHTPARILTHGCLATARPTATGNR